MLPEAALRRSLRGWAWESQLGPLHRLWLGYQAWGLKALAWRRHILPSRPPLESTLRPSWWDYTSTGILGRRVRATCFLVKSGRGAMVDVVGGRPYSRGSYQATPAGPVIPRTSMCLSHRGEIAHRNFKVLSPDPHRFDGDKDGVGCER